jgi:tRNA (cmo5U34)-methyltransferase
LDTIARILGKYRPGIDSFLDLGCGDGFLGYFLHELYPDAHGVFVDISSEMIEKAGRKSPDPAYEFIVKDSGKSNWYKSIRSAEKFDLVISGYAIHHLENVNKSRLYRNIFRLLNPEGFFLNLEHVLSPTRKLEDLLNDLFEDGMYAYQKHIGDEKTREEIKKIYYDPNHKILNKLEPVETQCSWLREIGFSEVDCYMKIFELALFGGMKRIES